LAFGVYTRKKQFNELLPLFGGCFACPRRRLINSKKRAKLYNMSRQGKPPAEKIWRNPVTSLRILFKAEVLFKF